MHYFLVLTQHKNIEQMLGKWSLTVRCYKLRHQKWGALIFEPIRNLWWPVYNIHVIWIRWLFVWFCANPIDANDGMGLIRAQLKITMFTKLLLLFSSYHISHTRIKTVATANKNHMKIHKYTKPQRNKKRHVPQASTIFVPRIYIRYTFYTE